MIILINCEKILSGKEDGWWIRQFIYIINSLSTVCINNNKLITLHYEVQSLVAKLLVKFDLFNDYFKALDNYHILCDIDEDSFQYFNLQRHNGNIPINYDLNKAELFEFDHFLIL